MRSRGALARIKEYIICGIILCILSSNGLSADTCKLGCSNSDTGILKYAPGNVYEYSIDSLMTVGITGNDADETALKITGHAKLFAEDNCVYSLQLEKITVNSVKDSLEKHITDHLKKVLKFSMSGGELNPEICADPSDSIASLNIKRGIISLLQTSEKSQETDVFGVCPTLTSVLKAGSGEVITKVRNLNSCSYREKISNGLITGVVNSKAGIKSSAILNADYSKELKLSRGLIENVQLFEEYKFAAFANGAGVAKAKVRTILKLEKVGNANAPQSAGESASIIFEQPSLPSVKNGAILKKVFTNTVNLVNEHVQGDAAQYFIELIRLMRSSDTDTLIELSVVPHVNKVLARKVYLDALFRVGTSNAVKAIVRQVSKMSEMEKKLAFLSLNLVQSVEKDALNQAATLLNPNSPKEAYLAIGNLVNKYCKQGTCDQSEVNVVSKKFSDSLKHCKANTKKDEDRFVNVLKGIRNTHKIADASTQVLIECASTGSARLRVAAIQAFVAASCNAGLQAKALGILKDRNEDSEIRIEAFLATIACPNAILANEIADIVNSEPVYQVGGFISSNLKAIRDSTDATREAARHYLGNIRVTKKFPIDPRRYSFNNEFSYAVESLGMSASADYNLIYSQKGYLPRSARLNLTSEIFGSNFNILEINARQENIEEILGYYFGPKGYFHTEGRNILGNIAAKTRSQRSIADDTEKFSKKYKTYGSKSTADINFDLAIRVFGSELFFISLADDVPQTVDDVLTKFTESAGKIKSSLKNFEHEYSCHSLFLDTEFVYPTGVGLPLELNAQGTSTSKLGVATEIDIDAIIEHPIKTKYRVKIVPSVDVNVNGQIRFNALVLAAGIRSSSSLHSSTGSDVRFDLINDANGFNVDIAFPRENLELVDLKHNVEFVIAEQDKETKVVPLRQKKKKNSPQEGCFDQLHYIGMTVCFTSALPDTGAEQVGILLSGPVHVALRLQTEKNINLLGTFEKAGEIRQWKLKYSTPGSQVPHDTELSLQVGTQPKMFVRAALQHHEIHLSGEAGVQMDDKEIAMYGKYDVNGEETIQKIGLSKNGNEYRPLIEIKTNKGVSNEINGYRADGRITKQENGKNIRYTYENFQLVNKEGDSVVVNGWSDVIPFKSELTIQRGGAAYEVKSHFNLENGYAAGLFIRNQNSPHSNGASINLQLGENSVKDALVVAVSEYNFQMENEFVFTRDEKNVIKDSKFTNNVSLKQGDLVLFEGKLNGEAGPKLIEFNVEASKDTKKASLDFQFAKDQRLPGDYSLGVNAKLNKHFVDFKSKIDVKGVKYLTENIFVTSWGTKLTANGEVGQRFTPQDVYIDLQGTFQITTKDKQGSWELKVIGTPDKTNSDFKLNRENADLIVYSGETTHPQDKIATGKLNLQIKDLLGAKADFKINKGGKGDLSVLLNFKKAQRKVNLDSKFTITSPKYDVETTIVYDTDKKLFFKTENVVDKTKLSTKNLLDINGDTIFFDLSGSSKGEWRLNGEIDGKFSLKTPNGREFEGQVHRKVTTAKNGIAQGTMSFSGSDKLPTNEKRTIEHNGKLEKFNAKTNELSATANMVYTNFAGKKLEISQKVKHAPKGTSKSIELITEIRGEILSTPVDFTVTLDEYDPVHAIFRISAKCGDIVNAIVNGNFHLGDRAKPATYELQANVEAPHSDIKTFSLTTSGKYLRPEVDDGVRSVELHVDQQAGDKSIKFNTFARGNRNHGTYNLDLATSFMPDSIKLDGTFSREKQDEGAGKQKYNMNYAVGDKHVKTSLDLSYIDSQSGELHYVLDTSFPSIKNLDLIVRSKKNDDTVELNSELQLNGQNYALENVVFTGEHKKGAVIKIIFPEKTTTVSGIVEILGERKSKLTLKIVNLGDLNFDHINEYNFKTFDDFFVTSHTNSEKLKIDSLELDIRSQGSSGLKGVELSIKNAKGLIIAGSATYSVKKEKSKTIVEGQGQVQIYQKSNNANFKIIHQLYDISTDQEVGFSFTINGTFGPKNAVSTLKITNKNFQAKVAVCEEKKQCTNVELRSMVTIDPNDVTSVQHDLMVLIDLRELGYPHEFELQSKSSRKGFKFNHEIESNIISNSNIKYQLTASISPHLTKAQIKLPSRESYVEIEEIVPQNIFGHYQGSVTFYFDRVNKPNDVTKLIACADITGVEKISINAKGEIRFEHPTIRTLSISGNFDVNRDSRVLNTKVIFDIFKTPEQKIIATSLVKDTHTEGGHGFNITTENVLKSSGLGFQYEASGHTGLSLEKQEFSGGYTVQSGVADIKFSGLIFATKDRAELILNGLSEQILNIVAEFNRNKLSSKINANFQLFSLKPLTVLSEIDSNTAKFVLKRAGIVDVSAEVKLGKEAKFVVKDGAKKLFGGRIGLDAAHFLATSFESNEEDTKAFLKSLENTINNEVKVAKEQMQKRFTKIKEVIERQAELAKNSAPDFNALQENLQLNLEEILKDLENDPAIKQFMENYRKYYGLALKMYNELSKTIAGAFEQIHASLKELLAQIQGVVKKTILPAWEEFSKKMTQLLGELQIEAVKLLNNLLEQVLKSMKSLETDLKAFGKPVYEVLKPIAESTQELFKILLKDYEELMIDLREYWSKLPTFEAVKAEIKKSLDKLKAVDQILVFLRNIIDQVNMLWPAQEQLIPEKLYSYIEAKLRGTQINDMEALEELYQSFIATLTAIWKRCSSTKLPNANYLSSIPMSLEILSSIPAWITFRFSALNFILNERLDAITDLSELLKPPFDFLPPFDLVGHIADGKNVFTFDGNQFTFQGSCKYVLVQDVDENDFSVVATIKDGKLKAMTMVDAKNFAEFSDTGVLKLNGKPAEFPVHADSMHAWKRFYTMRMRTEYGVEVTCTNDLKVCHVTVNGFFTSKTRGLFGNGNAEPYDDYTMVDGKIADNYVEFVNEYGMGNCPAVATTDSVNVERDAICTELFGLDSSLVFGYLFIDHKPYRDACDKAVLASSENKEEAACNIAMTYASGANIEKLPVFMPNRCLKCTGPVGQRDIGDEFNVKIPTNKADIVFVVDLDSSKNVIDNLVTPAIGELRNQLKTRGFTDAQIIVIAFSADQLYPALLTSSGGKLNYNGKLSAVILNGPSRPAPIDTKSSAANDVLKWLENLESKFAPQADETAFRFALDYPFRAGAAKSIIAVRSNQLEYTNILKFVRAHLIGGLTHFDGASLHLIGPVPEISADGVQGDKLVGFNSRIVATLDGKDAKKRQKLKFKNDMGIDFVLQNNGWVFASQNFDALSGDDQKKSYLNQVTSSIADTLFKTDIVSECTCVKSFGMHAEHKCSIKSSNFVPNKRPKGA